MNSLATTILSGSLSAFAENTTKYWEPRPNCQDTIACVNDKEYSDDIKISYNNDSEQFIISYNGKGVVINWEFPLSEENKDYKIVSQSNNTIYIKLISNSFFSFNIIAGSIISLINSFSTEFIVLDILLYTELLIKSDE